MRKRRPQNRVEQVNVVKSESGEEAVVSAKKTTTNKRSSSPKNKTPEKPAAKSKAAPKSKAASPASKDKDTGKKTKNPENINEEILITDENSAYHSSEKIVFRHVFYTAVAGVIPLPAIDIVAIGALQLKMLRQISMEYNVQFSENLGKSIIASLTGSIIPTTSSYSAFRFVSKLIPGIGTLVGSTFLPLFAGAATYAIGEVFIQHFESGGTFLDFDPKKVREHFAKLYDEGKIMVNEIRTSSNPEKA